MENEPCPGGSDSSESPLLQWQEIQDLSTDSRGLRNPVVHFPSLSQEALEEIHDDDTSEPQSQAGFWNSLTPQELSLIPFLKEARVVDDSGRKNKIPAAHEFDMVALYENGVFLRRRKKKDPPGNRWINKLATY